MAPTTARHFQLAETLCNPQPITRPHPPILIGGMGEHKTLRLVAQYGDACNLFARTGIETLRSKLDVLKRHCERLEPRLRRDRKDHAQHRAPAPGRGQPEGRDR